MYLTFLLVKESSNIYFKLFSRKHILQSLIRELFAQKTFKYPTKQEMPAAWNKKFDLYFVVLPYTRE